MTTRRRHWRNSKRLLLVLLPPPPPPSSSSGGSRWKEGVGWECFPLLLYVEGKVVVVVVLM